MTTVRVNLLPAAYDLRCRRCLRVKRWVVLAAAVIALQIPAFLALREMGSHARDLQKGLFAARQQRDELVARIATVALKQTEVNRQIELADRLSLKHRWSELFADVAACLPEKVVLNRLETDPPKGGANPPTLSSVLTPVRGPEGAGKTDTDNLETAGGLFIEGLALDHDAVASFLRNLNAAGRVGQCSLESTQRQPLLKGEAISFTVRTKW